jgi:ketosteroid isomerase-like protein
MPTRERVLDFIDRMKRGESLELMPDFYAEDATAQENGAPPRVGLAALMAHERAALERFKFDRVDAPSFSVDGDVVAINWVFELSTPNGHVRLDEIAYQHWRGDKIVRERFYYDPGQRKPS